MVRVATNEAQNGNSYRFRKGVQMTHYDVLSVAPTATLEQIKKARRDAAQLYHPDRLQQMGESVRGLAEDQLKKINAAYDVLSDPRKRRAYDASLNMGPVPPAAPPPRAAAPKQRTASASNAYQSSNTRAGMPPRSERHAQAWTTLLTNQRRRRWGFWVGTALSSVALLLTLVVLLFAVANAWVPPTQAVPRPLAFGIGGVLAQLVALASVAHMAHVVGDVGQAVRFATDMLVPTVGTWLLVAFVGIGVLLINSSEAALRVAFVVPLTSHLLFCWWRVHRAVVRLDRAEQHRLLWNPV